MPKMQPKRTPGTRLTAYKVRIYPKKKQIELIHKTFGCVRFVYNYMLAMSNTVYEEDKLNVTLFEMNNSLTTLKKDYEWLNEIDSTALTQACANVTDAKSRFFSGQNAFPKFKSKKRSTKSYTSISSAIEVDEKRIKVPKLGWIRYRDGRKIPEGHPRRVTLSVNAAGQYYASVLVEVPIETNEPAQNDSIGIDVGLAEFYTDSNGNVVENPRFFRKAQKKLSREQRRLSRKQKGSKSWEKQRVKVARAYLKVSNQHDYFQHVLAKKLIDENQIICVEDLNIEGMIKNHKLAKSIQDAAWGKFMLKLETKAAVKGREIIKVPTFYPSSQLCSCCGAKNPDVKNLAIRKWKCPQCGTEHQRDENAANNIRIKGLTIKLDALKAELESQEKHLKYLQKVLKKAKEEKAKEEEAAKEKAALQDKENGVEQSLTA